jgi:hypothetical protein
MGEVKEDKNYFEAILQLQGCKAIMDGPYSSESDIAE